VRRVSSRNLLSQNLFSVKVKISSATPTTTTMHWRSKHSKSLMLLDSANINKQNKKAVLSQGKRAMPQLFFSVG